MIDESDIQYVHRVLSDHQSYHYHESYVNHIKRKEKECEESFKDKLFNEYEKSKIPWEDVLDFLHAHGDCEKICNSKKCKRLQDALKEIEKLNKKLEMCKKYVPIETDDYDYIFLDTTYWSKIFGKERKK